MSEDNEAASFSDSDASTELVTPAPLVDAGEVDAEPSDKAEQVIVPASFLRFTTQIFCAIAKKFTSSRLLRVRSQ